MYPSYFVFSFCNFHKFLFLFHTCPIFSFNHFPYPQTQVDLLRSFSTRVGSLRSASIQPTLVYGFGTNSCMRPPFHSIQTLVVGCSSIQDGNHQCNAGVLLLYKLFSMTISDIHYFGRHPLRFLLMS